MIELNYAVKVEETYLSKTDKKTRINNQQIEYNQREQEEQQATGAATHQERETISHISHITTLNQPNQQ